MIYVTADVDDSSGIAFSLNNGESIELVSGVNIIDQQDYAILYSGQGTGVDYSVVDAEVFGEIAVDPNAGSLWISIGAQGFVTANDTNLTAIDLANGDNELLNYGEIIGNIELGGSDTIKNYGSMEGGLSSSSGDFIYNSGNIDSNSPPPAFRFVDITYTIKESGGNNYLVNSGQIISADDLGSAIEFLNDDNYVNNTGYIFGYDEGIIDGSNTRSLKT